MKIVMVGQGAFGRKHLDGLKNIEGVEVANVAVGSAQVDASDSVGREALVNVIEEEGYRVIGR